MNCSNSFNTRIIDTDIAYTGESFTCGDVTVNTGDSLRKAMEVLLTCQQDVVVAVSGNTLPVDVEGKKVAFVGSGTYTQSGGPDIVVPDGSMGILFWDGSEWSLSQSVEMPTQVADGEIVEGDDRAISGDTAYKDLIRKDYLLTTKGKNLYNKEDDVGGFITLEGELQESAINKTSDFIQVDEGVTYTMSGGYGASASKGVLLFGNKDNEDIVDFYLGSDTFTPTQDGYIKVNSKTTTSDVSETLQIEVGSTSTSYEPYTSDKVVKNKFIPNPNGIVEEGNKKPVSGGEVYDKTLTKDKYLIGVQLYDKDNDIEGVYISSSTGGLISEANSSVSEPIPVQGLDKIIIQGREFASAYRFLSSTNTPLKAKKENGQDFNSFEGANNGVELYVPAEAVYFQFTTKLTGN